MTLPDALRNFAERIPVLDARFFVTAVLTQREAGGNLAEVLDNLAAVIRERFKVKRQMRVISAHGRITGWVLACLPPALAVALVHHRPVHMQTLLATRSASNDHGRGRPAGRGHADHPQDRQHRILSMTIGFIARDRSRSSAPSRWASEGSCST